MTSHEIIYHITDQTLWAAAVKTRNYESPSLRTEGFIHLSTPEQLTGSLNNHFKDATSVLVLEVAVKKLTSPLKWEAVARGQPLFPHLYGPLNLTAVNDVIERKRTGPVWEEPKATLDIDSEFASRLEQGWKKAQQQAQQQAGDKPFDYENDYSSDHYTDEEELANKAAGKVAVVIPSKFVGTAAEEEQPGDDDWDD